MDTQESPPSPFTSSSTDTIINETNTKLLLILENLDILQHVVSYIGPRQYRFVASINRTFRTAYSHTFPNNTRTCIDASTVTLAKFCYEDFTSAVVRPSMTTRWHLEAQILVSASKHGNVPALQFLRSVNDEWSEHICMHAAQNGQLHVLQWARQNDCPWDR